MRRRDFLAGAALSACAINANKDVDAYPHLISHGFGDKLIVAFDGLDYPSWDARNLALGFMAFLSVYAPNVQAPFTIAMSLQRIDKGQVLPIPVKNGDAFKPYRSVQLNGTATDWAVIPRQTATVPLFIPYRCIDTRAIPNLSSMRVKLYCRIIDANSNHLKQYDKDMNFSAAIENDSYLVQRIVAPKAGADGELKELDAEYGRFTGSFANNRFSKGMGE